MAVLSSRRDFVTGLLAVSGVGLIGENGWTEASEPETKTVNFGNAPGLCISPLYVAEQLLRAEGFDKFTLVETDAGLVGTKRLAAGEFDFNLDFGTAFIIPADRGANIKVLSGLHTGCYDLFAHENVRSIIDLKGKRVGAGSNLSSDPFVFLSAMDAYVGLDPAKDLEWVQSDTNPIDMFINRKIDAFVSFGSETERLKRLKAGHVLVSGSHDRPWSQYFCCMLAANAEYVQKYPRATKSIVRAVLKAADLCVTDPTRVAQRFVEMGYAENLDATVRSIQDIRFNTWRDHEPGDTLRFFSLRLREAGIIASSPEEIVSQLADWRFLNELRQELKT
jgi:NitT/TauT family transport system substrate-binding protein